MVTSSIITETVSLPAPVPTTVTISSSNLSPTTAVAVTFTGEVYDEYNNVMSNITVYLFANGLQIASAVTTSTGYTITHIFASAGTYTVDVATDTTNT